VRQVGFYPFRGPDASCTQKGMLSAHPVQRQAWGRRLYEQMPYTLRGPLLAALPFFDRDKVVALLDELPGSHEPSV
jgi:hypothetical protein